MNSNNNDTPFPVPFQSVDPPTFYADSPHKHQQYSSLDHSHIPKPDPIVVPDSTLDPDGAKRF